jgi:hypothetical protein
MRIHRVLMLLSGLLLMVGCEKIHSGDDPVSLSDDPVSLSDEPASSGIYVGGECIVPIGSAFMGGGVADPNIGSSHRCHMYEQYFEQGPSWDEVASVVGISGFQYTGVTYSEPGQFIDFIGISGALLNLDTSLAIPLEQGKYKGGCELVSSVKITNFNPGTVKNRITGDMNDDGKIDIAISLKDGRTLRIHYRGKILYDGYY